MSNDNRSRKLWRILLSSFGVCMVLLTLLSNTFQNAMLPKVLTSKPSANQLQSTIDGKGRLQAVEQVEITNPNGLPILRIPVKKGGTVAKGDILVEYDTSDLNRQRLDQEDAIKQKKLNSDKFKQDFIQANMEGDELRIQEAKRNLESYRIELAIEERKLQSLLNDIEKKRYSKAPFAGSISEIKGREGVTVSPGQQIATLMKKSEGYQFTFNVTEEQSAWLEEKETLDVEIKDGNKSAQVTGFIDAIEYGNSEGTQGSGGESAIFTGQSKDDEKKGSGTSASPTYRITVRLQENPNNFKLKSGLKAAVTIVHTSEEKGYTISDDWIKKDKDGKYVLLVEEQLGAFGNDYTVKKAYVHVIESSNDQSLVTGLTQKDQIITETNEPVKEGDRVRIH